MAKAVRIAGRQHGAIGAAQLVAAGFSRARISRWVAKGLLHPQFRGVYRLGHRAASVEARDMAAVLACGNGAVLSGAAAAHLLGLLKGPPPAPEVTTTANRQVRGVIVHRTRNLPPTETTTWRGIPITTPARTLQDLASTLSLDALARACHQADVLHGTTSPATRTGRAGAARLRAITEGDAPILLSRLERRFRRLLADHGLPLPRTNRRADAHFVDCRWAARRLTVELDGYRFHRTRHAWEQDRARERAARARGDEHRRYTWADVAEEPAPMLAELARLLGAQADFRRKSR